MDNPFLFPAEESARLFDERMEAERQAERQRLEDEMRKPLADVSRASGEIERNSPLFYGTGANPTLF